MTDDHTPPPARPGDDARWFLDAVDPVVGATPVPDAWNTIRDRAGATEVDAWPAPTTRSGPRPWMLAVAAALAAVAGFAAVLAVASRDGRSQVTSRGPTGPTGFPVPQDRPATSATTPRTAGPGVGPAVDGRIVLTERSGPMEVRAGQPFTIDVEARNVTDAAVDVGGCFPAQAVWYLARDGRQVAPGGAYTVDCGETSDVFQPGEARAMRGANGGEFSYSTGARSFDGDPALPPGEYQAVLRIEGFTDPLVVPVTITS